MPKQKAAEQIVAGFYATHDGAVALLSLSGDLRETLELPYLAMPHKSKLRIVSAQGLHERLYGVNLSVGIIALPEPPVALSHEAEANARADSTIRGYLAGRGVQMVFAKADVIAPTSASGPQRLARQQWPDQAGIFGAADRHAAVAALVADWGRCCIRHGGLTCHVA